ncbi:phage portal protein [Eremococcus coleocola]|uniref:phage portal protein n=1 Tax=Eremococcus coleocola TaxID=88132 RepID=UPI00040B827F|nr:phage portal protein [Eremococcus coleocola]
MGILDKLFKRSSWHTPSQTTPAITTLSKAGYFEDVPNYTRLSDNPDVRIAVDKIADLVSNMTIHLMENGEKGDVRVKNELSRKIDIEPCTGMTRKTWIYKIVSDLLLYGDGNSLVHISVDEESLLIKDLVPLDMGQISWHEDNKGIYVDYKDSKYHMDELIHFVLNPDPSNPWFGRSYRFELKDIANNLNQATRTKNDFMRGQYMPNLIVKVDALNEEVASREGRERVKEKYLDSDKSNEPWIIPADLLEVEQIRPLSLNDIALNDSVEIDKRTLAGLLQVPPYFLGVGEFNRLEYNNFIDTRIMGIAQIIAQTLTRDILLKPEWYFKLNPRSLYAYNLNDLVTAGVSMVNVNAMRRNELRDWIGLNPDEEMEELIVLENYIPQEKLGDQEKIKGGD